VTRWSHVTAGTGGATGRTVAHAASAEQNIKSNARRMADQLVEVKRCRVDLSK
jgi:hypothetical protein